VARAPRRTDFARPPGTRQPAAPFAGVTGGRKGLTRRGKQGIVARSEAKTKGPGKLGHVLLVEDDALIAVALEGSLLDAGAKSVTICSTTADALAALREHKPDGLVLDVHLADRDDGWALAELVNSVGPRPPRIVFSTGAPQDIPPQIAELGPVLEKPYDHAELIAALCRPPREGLMARIRDAFGKHESGAHTPAS
jgi:CheY-like chemotaxis protein